MSPRVLALGILLLCSGVAQSQSLFSLKLDAGAIVSLRRANDVFPTEYIQNNRRLGDVSLRYRGKDGAWQLVDTAKLASDGHASGKTTESRFDYSCAEEQDVIDKRHPTQPRMLPR